MGAARVKPSAGSVHSQSSSGRPPQPPETLVIRERLYAALDHAVQSPLTLLIAPAGSGKTVLLSAWSQRHISTGSDVIWVAAHDHHLVKARLCEAVRKKNGPIHKVLEDAAAAGVEPVVVVVDDAHLLERAQLQLLEEILSTKPEAVRLVLATRRDLPLPVLALDLTGQASTLRVSDLTFHADEAADLVRAHAESATHDDIARLLERTAGWAAALVLAARSLAKRSDTGILSPALVATDQPVLDLLLGEAFTTLSEPARQMLLSTFADPFTSAARAAVLSGNPAAGDLLTDLTSSGLLVTAYAADEGVIYRYHPLLVELLRRRVFSQPEDAEVVRLAQLRAASHDESIGEYAAALGSAIEAADATLVTRLLIEYGPEILSTGDVAIVGVAFDSLPPGHIAEHPYLLGVQGLHRRCTGDVSGAVMISARASRAAMTSGNLTPRLDDTEQALAADSLLLRLWQSRYGWQDCAAAISDAHEALGCQHDDESPSAHRAQLSLSPARMSWLMVELAAAETWTGELTSASIHVDEALVSARLAGPRHLVTAGLAHRAVIEYSRGEMQSAATTARAALDLEDAHRLNEDYTVRAHVVLGLSALSRLDLDEARKWQERVESSEVSSTDSVVAALRTLLRSWLHVEAGEVDVARLELTSNPSTAGPLPAFLSREFCFIRYRCATLVDDTAAANQQIEALRLLGFTADAELLATVSAAGGHDDEVAVKELGQALTSHPQAHPVLLSVVATLQVCFLLRSGDEPSARAALIAVMNRMAPQQTLQALTAAASDPAFLDLMRRVALEPDANQYFAVAVDALTSHHTARREAGVGIAPVGYFVGRVDADVALPSTTVAAPQRTIQVPAQPSRHAVLDGIPIKLTAREADVLGQLALGSSYTEIAKDLYITENTVKTHLASLYRKLAVDKRSAALRVARSLGLLT